MQHLQQRLNGIATKSFFRNNGGASTLADRVTGRLDCFRNVALHRLTLKQGRDQTSVFARRRDNDGAQVVTG
jgi:hypothetical protein